MKSFLITILVSLAFIQATAQVPGKVPSSWAKEKAHTVMTRYPSALTIPFKPWCYPQGYFLMGLD